MSVLERIASALGRNDEQPNVALAAELAAALDAAAIAELAAALATAARPIRHDAIKTLYELGERRPDLIVPHADAFFALIAGRDNRLVWGGLSALAAVAEAAPGLLAARMPEMLDAADRSSVIAKDMVMKILAALARSGHGATALPTLLDRLETAAPNQFPMYAEIAAPAVDPAHRARFAAILTSRLAAIPQPAKRKRVEKVLRQLSR